MSKKEKTTRINQLLVDELDFIRKKRLESKIDHKKIGDRKLTGLIVKHDLWPEMKADIIKIDNKKIKEQLKE